MHVNIECACRPNIRGHTEPPYVSKHGVRNVLSHVGGLRANSSPRLRIVSLRSTLGMSDSYQLGASLTLTTKEAKSPALTALSRKLQAPACET
jgi:hypothetical protein